MIALFTCARARACIHTHAYTQKHTHLHTCIHTKTHTLTHMHTRKNTHTQQGLESLCWMNSGKEFAASFSNGVIRMWSVKSNDKPYKLVAPHGQ